MAALRVYGETYGDFPTLVLSGRLPSEQRDAMSLALSAGVQSKVIDLKFIDTNDMPALYSAAEAMIFPSLFEGFGLPLVEAMICGCPIVASNTTTVPEITDGAALLFDPLDPVDIAHAIRSILTDGELRTRLRDEGYQQSIRLDWANIIPKLLSVYRLVG